MNLAATHNEAYGPRSRACMVAVAVESTCLLHFSARRPASKMVAALMD